MEPNKSVFDTMPPKTAFWIGFGTAILAMGTLGFIILGSCTMKGTCSFASAEKSVAAAPNVAAPSPAAAAATTIAVSKIAAVDKDDHIRGEDNAEITIIEYSDFQCPYCSRFHPVLEQAYEDYDGKVRWIYRNFPLSFHAEAENAAEAAECADEQGKYWEYADALFTNQTTLGDALYKKLATDLGLNVATFETCRSSDKYLEVVAQDTAEGAAAGVTGTPGSFIFRTDAKGTDQAIIIKGAQSASAVKAAVDSLLK